MPDFTHIDQAGLPSMVDVGDKSINQRIAEARAVVFLGEEIISKMKGDEIQMPKGPVFQTAIIAGTMGVKRTHDLIPFCHPLAVESIKFQIKVRNKEEVEIQCRVKVTGKTGVEMEALTGVSVAALTVYDMCKALSLDIEIKEIRLLAKSGGKRDFG